MKYWVKMYSITFKAIWRFQIIIMAENRTHMTSMHSTRCFGLISKYNQKLHKSYITMILNNDMVWCFVIYTFLH